jgi:hypothetical protein
MRTVSYGSVYPSFSYEISMQGHSRKVLPVLNKLPHHDMDVGGQLHAPATLPLAKEPLVPIG